MAIYSKGNHQYVAIRCCKIRTLIAERKHLLESVYQPKAVSIWNWPVPNSQPPHAPLGSRLLAKRLIFHSQTNYLGVDLTERISPPKSQTANITFNEAFISSRVLVRMSTTNESHLTNEMEMDAEAARWHQKGRRLSSNEMTFDPNCFHILIISLNNSERVFHDRTSNTCLSNNRHDYSIPLCP